MLILGQKDGENMARKETISKEYLFDTAFQMLREEGIENITARKLAAKAGCSTQPIFRLYSNMDELCEKLFERASTYFEEYSMKVEHYDNIPVVNLGMSYIQFAAEEKNLFQMLFLADNKYGRSLYEILNGNIGIVEKEVAKVKKEGCKNPEEVFDKMWIFIHGSACMSFAGNYNKRVEETMQLLKDIYKSFAF